MGKSFYRRAFLASVFIFATSLHATVVSPPNVAWSFRVFDTGTPNVASAPDGGFYAHSSFFGFNAEQATLTRYNASSTEGWRRILGNGMSSIHSGLIRSDSAGNAVIAGAAYYSFDGTNQGAGDVFLRKYTPAGTLTWGRQFGTPRYDRPTGLALDAAGAVHIGSGAWTANNGTPPPGSFTDARKYLANGTASWVTGINTQDGTYPGGSVGTSNGMDFDNQGNLFSAFSNYTNQGIIDSHEYLSRITPAGQLQWVKEIDGFGNAPALATAGADAYVVSGKLTKFDSDGNEVWSFSEPQYQLRDVHVSWDGRIFVAGTRYVDSWSNGFFAEFDPQNGAMLWGKTITPTLGQNINFYSLTQSGTQLIAAGRVSQNSTIFANEFVALSGVPEPSGLALAAFSLLALRRTRS